MRITIASEQRHDPDFDSLQIIKIVILGNAEGNPADRTLRAEIVAIPVAEPSPGQLIFAKSYARTIIITDLWGYLIANPAIGGALLTALAATISDRVEEWSSAALDVGE
jgi:hypothetical protein